MDTKSAEITVKGRHVTEVSGPYLVQDEIFKHVKIEISDSRISGISIEDPRPFAPCDSRHIIIPGFVDTHEHVFECAVVGGGKNLQNVFRSYAAHGTSSIAATASALNPDLISEMVNLIEAQKAQEAPSPRLIGIGLEGVLTSPEHSGILGHGGYNPILLKKCLQSGKDYICWASVAPERPEAPEAMEIIASFGVDIAVAHTNISYDEAVAVFRKPEVKRLIHTFNGMQGDIPKRQKTIVDAALENRDIWVELICDGHHWLLSRLHFIQGMRKGLKRCVLVSDALVHGEPGNNYIGLRPDQRIFVDEQGKVTSAGGKLAGGGAPLEVNAKNVSRYCSTIAAINAATRNPADSIGRRDLGRIEIGALGDLTIISYDLNRVICTIINGQIAYLADNEASELIRPASKVKVAA